MSVPLGKYWRSSPLVFSLVPRCQALGVTEEHLDADVDTELGVFGHFFALIPGQRRAQVFGESLDGVVRASRTASAVLLSGQLC